jgi:protein-S-isoprenylcysteine O-methyltransferase Ste14
VETTERGAGAAGEPLQGALDQRRRKRAIKRVKEKRDFKWTLGVYLVFNSLLVVDWLIFDRGENFWPGWIIVIWGLIMVVWAWNLYGARRPVGEEEIEHEMERLRLSDEQSDPGRSS